MPLIVRTHRPPPPPVSPADDRYPIQVTYIDPDGVEWPWSDPTSGIIVTSVTGIGSPPASYTGIALPDGGSLAQSYTATSRQIVIGLHVFDEGSQAGLLDKIDRLARALWTERAGMPAPGMLVFARPNGTVRQIEVYCTSGPEQTDTDATRNAYQVSTDYALTFTSALDPLFVDQEVVGPIVFEPPPPSGAGVPPMPPVLLKPRSSLGTTQVTNEGNGDAYPVWKLYGPGAPTVTNVTTGRSFSVEELSEGEVVTVDTRPGRQSAIDQDGNDRWGDLVKTSPRDLWVLPSGTSVLELEIANADAGAKIELTYARRWLRA